MKFRIVSIAVACLAIASLLFAQQQALPWFPYWDGKQTKWVTAATFKQQVGAANLSDVQSINGRLGAAESAISALMSRVTALEARPAGSLPTKDCATVPDGMAIIRLVNGTCLDAEVVVTGTNPVAQATDELLEATLQTLPETCSGKNRIRWVRDASTSTGGSQFYVCDRTVDTWYQLGQRADGTGYLVNNCPRPGDCYHGPNTAVVPSMPGPNAWTGANDFTQATLRLP